MNKQGEDKFQVTLRLSGVLLEEFRDAVYFDPAHTLNDLFTLACQEFLRNHAQEIEANKNGRERLGSLKRGRPIKYS